jgi:hypothetical protein
MADKKITAAAIIQKWDGGERLIAAELARKATKDASEDARAARPELARYLAPDFKG